MGTFQNTKSPAQNQVILNKETSNIRQNIVGNITNSMINRVTDNPFYFFNNMSITKVTFYNINKEHTTLDEVLENTNNLIGAASGLRFDKINNCILYGLPRIELNVNIGEFGTEADPIEGEAILPPNTFKPYQESYFSIDYLNLSKTLWFRIISVNIDTLPNGSNFYKLQYVLDSVGKSITPQVVNEYNFISENIGTSFPVLVDAEQYALQSTYQELINLLHQFYYEMFFKEEVQTFVFRYGEFGYWFYDPYLLKFCIDHGILSSNGKKYVHVDQPAIVPPFFSVDYQFTIFRRLEDLDSKLCYLEGFGLLVQDPMSLLTQRIEPYYGMSFRDDDGTPLWDNPLIEKIPYFDIDLFNLIPGADPFKSNDEYKCKCAEILYGLDKNHLYYKIIYSFLNGETITSDMLDQIQYIHFTPCKELYYTIPILIYIIQASINSLSA